MVLYLNSEAGNQKDIKPSFNKTKWKWIWGIDDTTNVLPTTYKHYGSSAIRQENEILLADVDSRENNNATTYYSSMIWDKIGKYHFKVTAQPDNLLGYKNGNENNNYITIAFYGEYSTASIGEAKEPVYKLIATDATHYKIGIAPKHKAPTLGGYINIDFKQQPSELHISWGKITSHDSMMQTPVAYSIKYSSSSEWVNVGNKTNIIKKVFPDDVLSISVKAVDEFGDESNILGPKQWAYPAINWVFKQDNHWSKSYDFGNFNSNKKSHRAIAQKIVLTASSTTAFNLAEMRIVHTNGYNPTTIKLSIYKNKIPTDKPDLLDGKIAEATAYSSHNNASNNGDKVANSKIETDKMFYFPNKVMLSPNTKYWIVLTTNNNLGSGTWASWIEKRDTTTSEYIIMDIVENSIISFSPMGNYSLYIKLGNIKNTK